jgi:peptide/nickel transport system substrate-binding protein
MQFFANVGHWNIWECAALPCLAVSVPLYNGLIEYNPETDDPLDLRGDLARSWELSKDGLTYTFRLHENAR